MQLCMFKLLLSNLLGLNHLNYNYYVYMFLMILKFSHSIARIYTYCIVLINLVVNKFCWQNNITSYPAIRCLYYSFGTLNEFLSSSIQVVAQSDFVFHMTFVQPNFNLPLSRGIICLLYLSIFLNALTVVADIGKLLLI